MNQLLDSLRFVPNIELALRVYGHQKPYPPQDCDDSRLEVPFASGNATRIQDALKNITPEALHRSRVHSNFAPTISRSPARIS